MIPLYHHDKQKLEQVLKFVRDLTKEKWLHIFGLPRMELLYYYLHKIEVDSVDTSALLYLTARRRYLIGSKSEQVRTVKFDECGCEGCIKMDPLPSPRSTDFFVNLYIHNIIEATKLADTPMNITISAQARKVQQKPMEPRESSPVSPMPTLWMTAKESLELRERKVPEKDINSDLSDFLLPSGKGDSKEQE